MSADFIPSEFADLDNNLAEAQLPDTGNWTWDPTARAQTLKGQAAGSGGNRWSLRDSSSNNLAYYDNNGSHVYDQRYINSAIYSQVQPNHVDSGWPVTWTHSGNALSNDSLPNAPSGTYDLIHSHGWNDSVGGPAVPGYHVWRDSWEYSWWNGSWFQSERKVGCFIPAGTTSELVALGYAVVWPNGVDPWPDQYTAQISMQAGSFGILDTNATSPRIFWQLISDCADTPTISETIYSGTTAVRTFASTPSLTQFQLGRSGVDTQVTIDGAGNAIYWKLNGVGKWTQALNADSSFALGDTVNNRNQVFYKAGATADAAETRVNSRLLVGGDQTIDASLHVIGTADNVVPARIDVHSTTQATDALQINAASGNPIATFGGIKGTDRGHLHLYAPAGQATGSALFMHSDTKSAVFGLDGSGNFSMVGSTGNMFIDTGTNTGSQIYIRMGGVTTDQIFGPTGSHFMADGVNFLLGQVTGTKWGTSVTDKQAWWGATPVVQPPNIANADGTLEDLTVKFNALLAQRRTLGLQATS